MDDSSASGYQMGEQTLEHFLLRQSRQQRLLALDQMRALSSCSNESSLTGGRNSSIGDHCFLEPLDLMDCSTSQSGALFNRARRLRLLESPSDSGVESGKENGAHSSLGFHALALRSTTPNGSGSSACMSPVGGAATAANHLLLADYQAQYLSQQQQQQQRLLALAGRPLDARGLLARPASSAGSAPGQSAQGQQQQQQQQQASSAIADDMPMLKRALQAPPLINTNMLMDEAYRHHKKFRAAQRGRPDGHESVGSTSRAGHQSACDSPACSPTPSSRRQSRPSTAEPILAPSSSLSLSLSLNQGLNQGLNQSQSPSLGRPGSSLANMHSTLLQKLNQPSNQMSQQQLKCNDLIHEIILSDDRYAHELAGAQPAGQPAPDKSPIPSGAVAPAPSPVSSSGRSSAGEPDKLVGSNLHRILISGQEKQKQQQQQQQSQQNQQNQQHPQQHSLPAALAHHLVDEDYITKRLLSGAGAATRRHQQHQQHQHQHARPANAQGEPGERHQQRPRGSTGAVAAGAHSHHRPSSSCASSSSPSPSSSLSTLSPSPSSSVSPDLALMSHHQALRGAHSQSASHHYIDQHVSLHGQRSLAPATAPTQARPAAAADLGAHSATSNTGTTGTTGTTSNSLALPRLATGARSPMSPLSDALGSQPSSCLSSASPSPTSPRMVTSMSGRQACHLAASQLSQLSHIGQLSLHCNSASSAALSAPFAGRAPEQAPANHLVGAKLNLLQSVGSRRSLDSGGGFGLLADVAVAVEAAEAARAAQLEQLERLERLGQLEQQVANSAQPIDLSKK